MFRIQDRMAAGNRRTYPTARTRMVLTVSSKAE